MTSNRITPNQREVLAARDSITGAAGYLTRTGTKLDVNAVISGGSSSPGLVPFAYDYVAYTNTNATTDTYVYKTGGAGGTTVATVTIVYTDSTKDQISTVTRT